MTVSTIHGPNSEMALTHEDPADLGSEISVSHGGCKRLVDDDALSERWWT